MWPFWTAQNSEHFHHLKIIILDSAGLEQKVVGSMHIAVRVDRELV